ncbi:unnamed protein product [Adineta ricciae]|uniref:Uncharacterized protein n=1 Tax=Adineta ricciae TaxID=249248 RepID=A0A814RXS4_ADIRI|nr:unnamed protein product [Adineta ricciae]CAF1138846.1 unnamed protein product [Adineta ricciae]
MSTHERIKTKKNMPLLDYVEKFIEKRDKNLRKLAQRGILSPPLARFDKNSVIIEAGDNVYPYVNTNKQVEQNDHVLDTSTELKKNDVNIDKQDVQLRLPVSESVEIRVRDMSPQPEVRDLSTHNLTVPEDDQGLQRTTSPLSIEDSLSTRSYSYNHRPVFYDRYVPVDHKPPSHQSLVHRRSDGQMRSLNNENEDSLVRKSPKKHHTYHNDPTNRYIEHQNTHTTVEVEFIRVPVMRLRPDEYYRRSNELAKMESIRSSLSADSTLQWRI